MPGPPRGRTQREVWSMTIHPQDRAARRPRAVLVPAVLLMALGVWVFFAPMAGSSWKTALRWIAYFYGAGALAVYLGAQAQGLLERATVKAAAPAPAMPYRMPTQTAPPAQPEPERRQPTPSHGS